MIRTKIFSVAAILTVLFVPSVIATDSLPHPGPYRLQAPANGFESFLEFQFDFKGALDELAKNPAADISVSGVLRVKPNADQPKATLKRIGEMNVDGQGKWIDVIVHPFASAKLGRRPGDSFYTVTFNTRAVANVSYGFQGRFIEQRQPDGTYTGLTGLLTRFKNGRKIAEANVNFIVWTYE